MVEPDGIEPTASSLQSYFRRLKIKDLRVSSALVPHEMVQNG